MSDAMYSYNVQQHHAISEHLPDNTQYIKGMQS